LIFDTGGNMYGTTLSGGLGRDGTVFELARSKNRWEEVVLYSFDGNDGMYSKAALIFDAMGNLFGTTSIGGTSGAGVVFELTP
jgi:hypothetical protein